jgi:putative FmdB family regulatory protein
MPTYEYACPKGHDFELFQKMSDKPRTKCPVCGTVAVRKISGGAGLHFKGSGFYITDYGKDGKGPRNDKARESSETGKAGETGPSAKSGENSKAGEAGAHGKAGDAGKHSKAGEASKSGGEAAAAPKPEKAPAKKAKASE